MKPVCLVIGAPENETRMSRHRSRSWNRRKRRQAFREGGLSHNAACTGTVTRCINPETTPARTTGSSRSIAIVHRCLPSMVRPMTLMHSTSHSWPSFRCSRYSNTPPMTRLAECRF